MEALEDSVCHPALANILMNTESPKGQQHKLGVVVRRYSPFVSCGPQYGDAPAKGSCSRNIALMPVDDDKVERFGNKFVKNPSADVILPKSFRSGKRFLHEDAVLNRRTHPGEASNRCVVTIDISSGPAEQGRWFDMWQAAVATDVLCVGTGQAGRSYHLGEWHTAIDTDSGSST